MAIQQIKEGMKPAEYISFAQLFSTLPMETVKASLCATDSNDQRERDLPAKYMVYFVIALSLYSHCSAAEVFRQLVETLKIICGPSVDLKIPAKSSLTYARTKLGIEPFRHIFQKVVKPIAKQGQSIGAFFRGLRLVAIDGVQFNIPDTPENEGAFGRAKTKTSAAAYPAIRCVGLIEIGTRVLFDYERGPCGGSKEASENELARTLLTRLSNDQLCLADRLYANYALWSIATATGASLLWRVKADVRLDCVRVLADGSYIARLYYGDRRKSTTYVEVRVIEYSVGEEHYRLITNISDSVATNEELANLYHERWEHENANKEQKQGLNAYQSTLRSKTPELAEQELIGLFLMYFIVRGIMHEAALSVGVDVDQLSFKHTLNVIRRRAPQVGASPPSAGLRSYRPRSARSANTATERAI
jgi:hypothetical protein